MSTERSMMVTYRVVRDAGRHPGSMVCVPSCSSSAVTEESVRGHRSIRRRPSTLPMTSESLPPDNAGFLPRPWTSLLTPQAFTPDQDLRAAI